MKLIFALGNAEPRYENTRHNIGFWVLDRYATSHEAEWRVHDKFRAHVAEVMVNNEKIILAKPTTYYNLVGESARKIMDFYKLTPADILIIHDDLALPLGTIRTRIGGSDAGNNGIKSLNQHVGESTSRLRIGITTEAREQIDDANFVLGKLTKSESELLDNSLETIVALLDSFIVGNFSPETKR